MCPREPAGTTVARWLCVTALGLTVTWESDLGVVSELGGRSNITQSKWKNILIISEKMYKVVLFSIFLVGSSLSSPVPQAGDASVEGRDIDKENT